MTRVKDTLRAMDVAPSKERGQNFVIDDSVINAIVGFGAPQESDNLVEIGPGLGALTKALSKFPRLSLVEIEEKFCYELTRQFPHAKVVNGDVREVALDQFGDNLVVFGNLPYVFSTEIVFHLIAHAKIVKRAVLLLQREFGERLAAQPGGREYGRISIATQLWADVKLGPIIPGSMFHPPTAVESRVIELTFHEPRFQISDMVWFEKVVKASFNQRRKKIHNSIASSGILDAERIKLAFEDAKFDSNRRAETFSIAEFVQLAEALKKQKFGEARA